MNLNPIDLNFIDGTNTYPLQEYIDDKINEIVSGNIDITNIDSSNVFISGTPLSNVLYLEKDYNNLNHIYLNNSNQYGEIRFTNLFTKSQNRNYNVRINYLGKLEVYHDYNLLTPTVLEGWKDIEGEIAGLIFGLQSQGVEVIVVQGQIAAINANLQVLNTQIAEAEAEISYLITAISDDEILRANYDFARGALNTSEFIRDNTTRVIALNAIEQTNSLFSQLITGIGVPFAIGGIGSAIYNIFLMKNLHDVYSNVSYSNNPSFTGDVGTSNYLYYEGQELVNLRIGLRNLNNEEGFINSNIITSQFIPSLNTHEIKIDNIILNQNVYTCNLDINSNLNLGSSFDYYRDGVSLTTSLNTTSNNAYLNSSNDAFKSSYDYTNYTSNNCYLNSSNNAFKSSYNYTNYTSNQCYLNSSNNAFKSSYDYTNYTSNQCYLNSSNNAFKSSYAYTNYAIANNVNYDNLLNEPWINSGTNIYNNNTGNVGINNNTPLQKLSMNGILSVENGNTTKIILAYNTTGGYRHSIYTNADASATNNNYIRFIVWRYGQATATLGDRNTLTLHADYNQFHGTTNRYTYINDETANKNSYNHTTAPLSLYQRTATSTTALSQENILHLSREGTAGQSYGARASFTIGRWENNSTNSRTRLDLNLSHLLYTDEVNVMTWRSDGRVGINKNNPSVALDVSGAITASGAITGGAGSLTSLNLNSGNLTNGGTISGTFSGNLTGNADTATKAYRLNPYHSEWHNSTDGKNRFNFGNNSTTYFGSQNGYEFRSAADGNIMTLANDGSLSLANNLWHKSLDGYNRLYYLNDGHTYFQTRNEFIFRNRDNADVAYISYDGYILANFATVTSARDYIGIDEPNTNGANSGVKRIKVYYGSFTEYHRCFIEDPIFTNRTDFLNEYEGRVVVSIGKIKQERRDGEGGEFPDWTILENKDGIRIDDAQPVVQLSRVRKDKRIYGVIGSKTTSYYSPDRIAINGIGEGAIWVVNTNGNIENGDLLQTSNEIGYAEKADDDLVRNSTIGKAVMNCSFDLNSPYYKTRDLGNGIIAAFIACVYMCS